MYRPAVPFVQLAAAYAGMFTPGPRDRWAVAALRPLAKAIAVLMAAAAAVVPARAAVANMERQPPQWLHAADGQILNPAGRPVVLHGVNLGLYPNEPFDFGISDFERIRRWGFNAVRIPVNWARIEPQPGAYDQEYLSTIDRYVSWAADSGLWVVLCVFGWPPPWAQNPRDRQRYAPPPGSPEAQWTPWVWTRPAFYLGLRDSHARFIALWQLLARRYRDNPAVCIYELLNEPERTRHLPASQEDELVYSLYRRALEAIRQIDIKHIVGYMPVGLENLGQPLGLRRLPGRNVCITYHFYLHEHDYWRDPRPERLKEPVERIYRQARKWGLPLVVTEFGCHQEPARAEPWIRDVLALWRQFGLGHLWWCYMKTDRPTGLLDRHGRVRSHILRLLRQCG